MFTVQAGVVAIMYLHCISFVGMQCANYPLVVFGEVNQCSSQLLRCAKNYMVVYGVPIILWWCVVINIYYGGVRCASYPMVV